MALYVDHYLTISDLPRECIEDCTVPGCSADAAVAYWREELEFSVNRQRAIDCLEGYGAWGRGELEAESDDDLAEKVLWLACGDFSEFLTECEREGVDPYGERPDDFSPSAGSDLYMLE